MMAFEDLEPFGGLAQDYRAGIVAATIANVHRDSEKKRDAFTAADFMPALAAIVSDREPVLLDDPDAQADLMDRLLFGPLLEG